MDKYISRVIALIIKKTGVEPGDISENSYFEDDLNMAEMELSEILATLEEEYKIEFEDEEREGFKSVMDIVETLVEKVE